MEKVDRNKSNNIVGRFDPNFYKTVVNGYGGVVMTDKMKCGVCGNTEGLKYGWTNDLYCSERCELSAVSNLHGRMPGAGQVPHKNWVPQHIKIQITNRWSD